MTYSIYTMFGYYTRGKFVVGGFKTLAAAKERCADLIRHSSRHAQIKLEVCNAKSKNPVGWMSNSNMGEIGIFWEDKNGTITRYGWN